MLYLGMGPPALPKVPNFVNGCPRSNPAVCTIIQQHKLHYCQIMSWCHMSVLVHKGVLYSAGRMTFALGSVNTEHHWSPTQIIHQIMSVPKLCQNPYWKESNLIFHRIKQGDTLPHCAQVYLPKYGRVEMVQMLFRLTGSKGDLFSQKIISFSGHAIFC